MHRHYWFPATELVRDAEGRAPNTYDLSIHHGLPKVGEANQELQKIALSCGLRTLRTSWKDFSAQDADGRRISFGLSFSEASSPVSGVITGNKQLTRRFLQAAGAAVPEGRLFQPEELEDAVQFAEDLGYPVVVKPVAGKSGQGVVAGILSRTGVEWAAAQISHLDPADSRFIVEDHVPGADYRIYVAYGAVLSVVLRRPANVTGDGVRSVAELVVAKNHQRRHNPHTRTRLIRCDSSSTYQLERQQASWDYVPAPDETVWLASAANISQGGDSTEVLPETHPSILDSAVRAVDAIPGLNQAGVDFLVPDHRRPLESQSGGICEINTTPALMANQAPVYGEPQPVAETVVRRAAESAGIQLPPREGTLQIAVRAQASPIHPAWLDG
ncbi:hypothetical protein BCY76_013245 [Nesterenkonia sp. PF2B19]|nr:hypothetical protein BCY76_013245 [Nesterenkonia sp. PF2B19]